VSPGGMITRPNNYWQILRAILSPSGGIMTFRKVVTTQKTTWLESHEMLHMASTSKPQLFHPGDRSRTVLRNVGILTHHQTASQPRRPRNEVLWRDSTSRPQCLHTEDKREHCPPKRRYTNISPHGIATQKTATWSVMERLNFQAPVSPHWR
jgi:hypothetical protein